VPVSPLDSVHRAAHARFTDFGGWQMPVQYDSVLAEHRAVREGVGVFDVSHLGRFEVRGPGAVDLVRSQLCNDVGKIGPGRAQYTMALNPEGGVEDDIIVWWLDADRLWVMPNGTNSEEIVARFAGAAPTGTTVTDVRNATVLLAVQGPDAPDVVEDVIGSVPGRFRVLRADTPFGSVWTAGTGYTGERGAEIAIESAFAEALWNALIDAGAIPAGLGARDTLRLEMGYPLWGQDLDPTTTPLEAGLGWVVAWDHDFVGRAALEHQRRIGVERRMIGFTTQGRAIPRHGQAIGSDGTSGTVTSGNFSPTLGHGIGLAYVAPPPSAGDELIVDIRGRTVPATVVDLPFLDR
jgi:aminomethyltransferase